jgi:NTE family protein
MLAPESAMTFHPHEPGKGFTASLVVMEVGGQLLGDGGLAVNAPFKPVLDEAEGTSEPVFILDLFARDGRRPTGLELALARKNAMVFGHQTWAWLQAYHRYWERLPATSADLLPELFRAERRSGARAPYDFSLSSAQNRWRAGRLDIEEGLARMVNARARAAIT